MFNHLKVKELKAIIKEYKKHAMIEKYSHLKKADLIKLMETRFILKDDKLYLKPQTATTTAPPVAKQKKRIAPTLISALPVPPPVPPPVAKQKKRIMPPQYNSNQEKRLAEATANIEANILREQMLNEKIRPKMRKDVALAKRIKGR